MKMKSSRSLVALVTVAGLLAACDVASPEPVTDGGEPAEVAARPVVDELGADAPPVAQLPGFDLSIELSGDDVVLQWQDTGAVEYEVWRATYPYFEPGDFGAYSMGVVAGTEFTEAGGNADGVLNAYYRVQEVGGGSASSTTVGRHALTFFNGFNKVPLSLETDIVDASDVFDLASPDAIGVYQHDSATQSYALWDPVGGGVPYVIDHGTTPVANMYMQPGESATRAIAGYVPAPGSLSVDLHAGDNLVHLPLDFPNTTASALLPNIPGAEQVGRWDAATQQVIWVAVTDPEVDALIYPGADLHIWMDADGQWPIEREAVSGDCCESNGNAYCDDAMVTECVCAQDSYCCSNTWDSVCADEVTSFGCGFCEAPPPPPPAEQGDCCEATVGVGGCTDPGIEACVCAQDSYCCDTAWDGLCVEQVETFGCSEVCMPAE